MNALVPVSATPVFSMPDIERVALAIAKGGLFGSKDPNAVLTLCLLAQAEGQHPAVVFRDYHIIQGKPAKKADAMLRDFINSGGKVEWHALTDDTADATFTHPSGSARIDWTLERAKTAGITNPMWKKYPRQMLRSRVISEGVRTVYPGATSGLYEVNEVHDIVAETAPRDSDIEQGEVVEHEGLTEPNRQTGVKLEGKFTSITGLEKAIKAFVVQMGTVAAMDEWYVLKNAHADLLAQAERDHPDWWNGWQGQPDGFTPLRRKIELLEAQLAEPEMAA